MPANSDQRSSFDLALSGNATVEPRADGPTRVIFTFSSNVVAPDGTISANEFTITHASFSNATIAGNTIILDLTGVVDQSIVGLFSKVLRTPRPMR